MKAVSRIAQKLSAIDDPMTLLYDLLAKAPVPFAIYRADGRCLVVNDAFVAVYGGEPPADRSVFDMSSPAAERLARPLRRALAGETVHVPGEWYEPHPLSSAGRRFGIELTLFPLRDREGRVAHAGLYLEDVTAEMALHESEEMLRLVLRASRAAAWRVEPGSEVAQVSENAADVFGGHVGPTREEQMELVHPDDRRDVVAVVAAALRGEEVGAHQFRGVAGASGEPRWFEMRTRIRRDHEGRVLGLSGLTIDVTERRRAEELHARSRELESQNRRVEEASRLKSEFLANMSHELRTPLNAILGFTQLLYDGEVVPDAPEHQEFLGDILASSRHLLKLINDVLDLAKVEAGKLQLRPEHTRLSALAGEVCGILRPLSAMKALRVEIEAHRSVDEVFLDPGRYKQLLYNYVSNAIKFTPEGGRIVVRTLPEDDLRFRVEVEDTGTGIAEPHLERLFLEFPQIPDRTGEGERGTGLGLALTRRIVEAQGGHVGARSTLGRGSVFFAVLPLRVPPSNTPSSPPSGGPEG